MLDKNSSIPIDADYYRTQTNDFAAAADPLKHFLEKGVKQGLNPTPYFATDWYAWQNPDYAESHKNPYLHYLEKGRYEARDPSPMIDMRRFLDVTGGRIARQDAYDAIRGGLATPALGVYRDWRDLTTVQERFTTALPFTLHRLGRVRPDRRFLVALQTGPGSVHRTWFSGDADRNWDLLVNYYDVQGFDAGLGEHVVFQPGTKFTAMARLVREVPQIFERYEAILFLDDDIEVSMGGLDRFFNICFSHGLDLAQMALSRRSHCIWPSLYQRSEAASSANGWRQLNAVEIMMPLLSRRAVGLVSDTFQESVSGFGLDLLWGQRVREAGGKIGIIDKVCVHHEKPIDDVGGAYYAYLRSCQINPKAELCRIMQMWNLKGGIHEID